VVWIGAVAAETKLLLSGHVWYCQNCPMDGATACGWSKKMNVLILSFCTRTLNPARSAVQGLWDYHGPGVCVF